jgi:hypothetical protein
MSDLTITEAFAQYGATLKNPQWAFSALAADGSLVLSCWQHKFTIPERGVMRYTDRLSRWHRINAPGRNLLVEHLRQAHDKQLPVRLVIVSTSSTAVVDAGKDASSLPKTFHLKANYTGQVVSFDGDEFLIDFRKQVT